MTTDLWVIVSRPSAPATLWIWWPERSTRDMVSARGRKSGVVSRRITAGEVMQAAITRSIDRVLDHLPRLHSLDDPDAVEAIHKSRVGLRRLRCDLRTFGDLVDEASSNDLGTVAKGLANDLGVLRDNDVVQMTIATALERLPGSARIEARPLFDFFEDEQKRNRERLLALLGTRTHANLLAFLQEARTSMPLAPKAARPARRVMPGLMARPWNHLLQAITAYGARPSDQQLHQVRIHTKRCRYGADVLRPVVGKRAVGMVEAMTTMQDTLGIVSDAAVIRTRLREAASTSPVNQNLIVALELWLEERAAGARQRWALDWQQAQQRPLRFWE